MNWYEKALSLIKTPKPETVIRERPYDYEERRESLVNMLIQWERLTKTEKLPVSKRVAENTVTEIRKKIQELDEFEKNRTGGEK
jgi:hypothetical protein